MNFGDDGDSQCIRMPFANRLPFRAVVGLWLTGHTPYPQAYLVLDVFHRSVGPFDAGIFAAFILSLSAAQVSLVLRRNIHNGGHG